VDGTDYDILYCGMIVERVGMLAVRVRKVKALTVKVETVTQIGNNK
jgi:hypothetical protein